MNNKQEEIDNKIKTEIQNGDMKEEISDCEIVSRMLDNPDKAGIYKTKDKDLDKAQDEWAEGEYGESMKNNMKIKAKKEGRPNVYIPEKESLKKFIKGNKFDTIHNFIPSGFMMLGADHDIKSVLSDIDRAERLGIFTDNSNMGHSLALIYKGKLECYDIGKITEEDIILT